MILFSDSEVPSVLRIRLAWCYHQKQRRIGDRVHLTLVSGVVSPTARPPSRGKGHQPSAQISTSHATYPQPQSTPQPQTLTISTIDTTISVVPLSILLTRARYEAIS